MPGAVGRGRVGTMDREVLTCPYCGREQLCHEPEEMSSYMCCTECECCGKLFWYSVTVTRTYIASKDETEPSPDE